MSVRNATALIAKAWPYRCPQAVEHRGGNLDRHVNEEGLAAPPDRSLRHARERSCVPW
jgi:hypothetical protein